MLRRELLAAGLSLPGAVIAATRSVSDPRLLQRAQQASWRRTMDFYFQKGLKGHREKGVLTDPFPIVELSRSILGGDLAAYDRIGDLFKNRAGRVVDPAGALLPIPTYLWQTIATMPDPPRHDSRELGAELLELYWSAALRDVPFTAYKSNPLARQAAVELRNAGLMTSDDPSHLFCPRDRVWNEPFSCYFFNAPLREWPDHRWTVFKTLQLGQDFLTNDDDWNHAQSGELTPARVNQLTSVNSCESGRVLGTMVYRDHPAQFFLSVALQLYESHTRTWSRKPPFRHQDGNIPFILGGLPHVLSCVGACVDLAMRCCWKAKWGVFNYPRPEEVAFWMSKGTAQLEEVSNIFATSALSQGSTPGLLSQMYPDGAPAHPAFPSGHAVAAGAAITALKFFLREDASLPSEVLQSPNGNQAGGSPSANDELDRLAWIISFGRTFAGIHFRSDGEAGIRLGENVALAYLAHEKLGHPVEYKVRLRRFDRTHVEI